MSKRLIIITGSLLLAIALLGAGVYAITKQQNAAWQAVRADVFPQLLQADDEDIEYLVTRELSTDIVVAYVIDRGDQYEFIAEPSLTEWETTPERLHETALKNLEKRSQSLNVEVATAGEDNPAGVYVIIELDDAFSAARILSSDVRSALSRELGKEYIAAIPTRDFLIAWHKDFPLQDAFIQQVNVEYQTEQEYPLTPNPFLVNNSGIQQLIVVENEAS